MSGKFKLLIAVSPVFVVILLPVIVGMLAKGDMNNAVEMAAKAGLLIEEREYEMGWRSSFVSHELTLPLPDRDVLVRLETSMFHGPYRETETGEWMWFSSDSTVYVDGEPMYSADIPPVIRSRLKLDRTGYMLVDAPMAEWPINDADYVDFRGFVGVSKFDPESEIEQFRYHLKGISIHLGKQLLAVSNLQSTYRVRESSGGLPLGSEVATIDRVSFRDFEMGTVYEANGLDLVSEAEAHNGMIGGSLQLKVQSLSSQSGEFGPLDFHVVVNGLVEEALVNANAAVASIYSQTKNHPKNRNSKLSQYMKNRGWKIFSGKPHIKYEIRRLGLVDGDLSASLDLGIQGLTHKDLRSSARVARKIAADLNMRVPKGSLSDWVAEHTRSISDVLNALPSSPVEINPRAFWSPANVLKGLNDAIKTGMVTDEGKAVSTQVRLRDGAVSINGIDTIEIESLL